ACSSPRPSSIGALMRWPLRDQPGAGGKVRGTTGPSSSRHRVVEPSGGSVEPAMTAVLWGEVLGPLSRRLPPRVGPPPPDAFFAQAAADLAAADLDALRLGGG